MVLQGAADLIERACVSGVVSGRVKIMNANESEKRVIGEYRLINYARNIVESIEPFPVIDEERRMQILQYKAITKEELE